MNEIIIAIIGSGVLSVIVSGIFQLITKKMYDKKSKNDETQAQLASMGVALREMMLDRIKHVGGTYILKGSVKLSEVEDLKRMHTAYKNLGGNGFADDVMARVKALPLK